MLKCGVKVGGAKVSWSGTQGSEDLRTNYQHHNDALPLHAGQNEGKMVGKRIRREADTSRDINEGYWLVSNNYPTQCQS